MASTPQRPLPARLVQRLRRVRGDAMQLIRDKSAWNDANSDEPPMDCEVERVVLGKCNKGIAAAERGEWDAVSQAITDAAEYMRRIRREEQT